MKKLFILLSSVLALSACNSSDNDTVKLEPEVIVETVEVEVEKPLNRVTFNVSVFDVPAQDNYPVVIDDGELPTSAYLSDTSVKIRQFIDNRWTKETEIDVLLDQSKFTIELDTGLYSLEVVSRLYSTNGVNRSNRYIYHSKVQKINSDKELSIKLLPRYFTENDYYSSKLSGLRQPSIYDFANAKGDKCYVDNSNSWYSMTSIYDEINEEIHIFCTKDAILESIKLQSDSNAQITIDGIQSPLSGSVAHPNTSLDAGSNHLHFRVNEFSGDVLRYSIEEMTFEMDQIGSILDNLLSDNDEVFISDSLFTVMNPYDFSVIKIEKGQFFVPNRNEIIAYSAFESINLTKACFSADNSISRITSQGEVIFLSYYDSENNAFCFNIESTMGNVNLDIFPGQYLNQFQGWTFESTENNLQIYSLKGIGQSSGKEITWKREN